MNKLVLIVFLALASLCHGQTFVTSCSHNSGFGSTVTSNVGTCTVASNELLVAFAVECGSTCLANLPSDPNATISDSTPLSWTAIQTVQEAQTNVPCSFSASPRCFLSLRMFWAYTGATSGSITVTQGSSASAQLVWTILRFSGVSASPYDQSTQTITTSPGGAVTITGGTLTLLSSSVTATVALAGSTANDAIAIVFSGFHGSGATELLILAEESPHASTNPIQSGYTNTNVGLEANGCSCSSVWYEVVANVANKVPRHRGFVN